MNISEQILTFGSSFNGRLEEEALNFSMDYVARGENEIAFDTLLEYVYENEVRITLNEFNRAVMLAKEFGIDENDLAHLKELIQKY